MEKGHYDLEIIQQCFHGGKGRGVQAKVTLTKFIGFPHSD